MKVIAKHLRTAVATLLFLASAQSALAWTISGTVYGGSTPLPSATVTLSNSVTQEQLGSTTTNSSGAYSFNVNDGLYNLMVNAPGFPLANVNEVFVSGMDVVQNVVLIQQALSFSGVVRLPDGTPANNITIEIFDETHSSRIAMWITDNTGSFNFLLAGGLYDIDVAGDPGTTGPAPDHFVLHSLCDNLQVSADLSQDIMLPFVTVTGKTIDGNGVPVPGVKLSVDQIVYTPNDGYVRIYPEAYYCGANYSCGVMSDTNGNYSMTLVAYADYSVTITPPVGSGFATKVKSHLDFRQNTVMDMLVENAYTYSGVVRLPDGTPANNIQIEIYDETRTSLVATWVTDNSGSFYFLLAGGLYDVDIAGDAGTTGPTPDQFFFHSLCDGLLISTNLSQDITLPFVTITGRTIDSNGAPVPGVKLSVDQLVYIPNDGYVRIYPDASYCSSCINCSCGAISDANGNYSMTLAAYSDYRVTITPPNGSGFAAKVKSHLDFRQNTVMDMLVENAYTYSGVVRLPDGAPANNITININDETHASLVATWVTDNTGSFNFLLAGGLYDVDITGDAGTTGPTPDYFIFHSLCDSLLISTDLAQDIVLPFVTITGRTIDSNGVPVPGVKLSVDQLVYIPNDGYVRIYPDASYCSGCINCSCGAISDANGNYSMTLAAYSDYSVTIIPPIGSGFANTYVSHLNFSVNTAQNVILDHPDTISPTILSGPTISAVTDTSAVISWQTDEPTTGGVNFGVTGSPSTSVPDTVPLVVKHSLTLKGLIPNTPYDVSVFGSDAAGNGPATSGVVSFTTKTTSDIKPPVIISGPIVSFIGSDSAVIEWSTNEPTTGHVNYGPTESLGQTASAPALTVDHKVTLTGLTSSTLHYFTIDATDGAGNGPTVSGHFTFTTIAAPDSIAPRIVEGPMVVKLSDSEATVVWMTDEPATSGVSYNDGVAYGVFTDDALTTSHSVHLMGLEPSTSYTYTVSTTDGLGNGPTLSSARQFTTLTSAMNDAQPPVIVEYPAKHVSHQQAIIEWRTDEPASTVIKYGLSPDQLTEFESHASLTQPHTLTLTGLQPGTTYYFRIVSTDAVGNVDTAPLPPEVWAFTTLVEPSGKVPVIVKLSMDDYLTTNTATVTWETDEPTDTVLEYRITGETVPLRRSNAELATWHQMTLKGLTPGANYEVAITATNSSGATAMVGNNQPAGLAAAGEALTFIPGFATDPEGTVELTQPTIVKGPRLVGLSSTSATIRWETNIFSNMQVRYGEGSELTTLSGVNGDIPNTFTHLVTLTHLTPNTLYSYRVESIDPGGVGIMSEIQTFTTLNAADLTPPVITTPPTATAVTDTSAIIAWSTNEASSTAVRFGTTSGNLGKTLPVAGNTLDHTLTLTGLTPGTSYYFVVESADVSFNRVTSSVASFRTSGSSLSLDSDGDGVDDAADNCDQVANVSQSDVNGNGIGDACDLADSDGDGFIDEDEVASGSQPGNRDNVPVLTVNVSPTSMETDEQRVVQLTLAPLMPGATLTIEQILDANGNGRVDADEPALRSFTVTDGVEQVNPNILADTDTLINRAITVVLNLREVRDLHHIPGDFLFWVSDGRRTSTAAFAVTPLLGLSQSLGGTVMAGVSPVPGALITLQGKGFTETGLGAFTDQFGEYRVEVPTPGEYHVNAEDYTGQRVTPAVAGEALVAVGTGLHVASVDRALTAGTVTINGHGGAPGVKVVADNGTVHGQTLTNADGSYLLRVPPGSYQVMVQPTDHLGLHPSSKGLVGPEASSQSVNATANVTGVNFTLSPATTMVSGKVRDKFGIALPGMHVDAVNTADPSLPVAMAVTAADGSYTLGLSASDFWSLSVMGDKIWPQDQLSSHIDDYSTATSPATGNNLTVYDANAWISGTVRDTAGQPLGKVTMQGWTGNNMLRIGGNTDMDGRYRLPARGGMLWKVDALTEDVGQGAVSEQSVTLVNGQTATLDFSAPAACATPPSLVVPVSDADGSYTVSWGASGTMGVTYQLQEATNPTFTTGLRTLPGVTVLSAAITGRSQNATYYYRVRAIKNSYTASAWRADTTGCAVPGTSAAATPASLTVPATDADGVYTISWGVSTTADSRYALQEATNASFTSTLRQVYDGPALSAAVTGRSQNVTYYYRVRAMKAGLKDSPYRYSNCCAVPGSSTVGIPASLTVPMADADGIYAITWGASATAGAAYELQEATNSTFTSALRTLSPGTALSADITGRSQNVTYYYRVRAVKSGYAVSAWRFTTNSCAVPGTAMAGIPASLTVPAADADGTYTITWSASTTAGVTYELQEATNSEFTSGLRTITGTTLSADITGRSQNMTYYYRVRAVKAGLKDSWYRNGVNSCAVPGTATAGMPASLTVPSADADGIYPVTWGASATPGAIYELQEATASNFAVGLRLAYRGTATTSNITGRSQNVTYYYRVRAVKGGLKDSDHRYQAISCAVPGTATAGTPVSLSVPATDPEGTYTISWGASATTGVTYELQEATGISFTAGLRNVYRGPATTFNATGRSSGVTYYYRVRAVKGGLKDSDYRTGGGCRVGP